MIHGADRATVAGAERPRPDCRGRTGPRTPRRGLFGRRDIPGTAGVSGAAAAAARLLGPLCREHGALPRGPGGTAGPVPGEGGGLARAAARAAA